MRGIFQEFKTFAIKGNVLDMAIGIIVGTAFNAIVSSLVSDIVTPLLAFMVGEVSFQNLQMILIDATPNNQAVTLNYGLFLEKVIDFVIIAIVAFSVVKGMNSLKVKAEDTNEKSVPTPKDIELLTEIRDLIAK